MTEICIDLEKSNSGLLPEDWLGSEEIVEIIGPPRSRKTTTSLKSAKEIADRESGLIIVATRTIRSAESTLETWEKYVDKQSDYTILFRAGADRICPDLANKDEHIPHNYACSFSKNNSIKQGIKVFYAKKFLKNSWKPEEVRILGKNKGFCPTKAQSSVFLDSLDTNEENIIFTTYRGLEVLRSRFIEEDCWEDIISDGVVVFDEWRNLNELSIKNTIRFKGESSESATETLFKETENLSLRLIDENCRSKAYQVIKDARSLVAGSLLEEEYNEEGLYDIDTVSPSVSLDSESSIPDRAFEQLGQYISQGKNVQEAKTTYNTLQFLSKINQDGLEVVADYVSSSSDLYLKLREVNEDGSEANRVAEEILRNASKCLLVDATPYPKVLDPLILGDDFSRRRAYIRPPFEMNIAIEGVDEGAYDVKENEEARSRLAEKVDHILEYLSKRGLEGEVIARNKYEKKILENELGINCGYARGDMVEGVSLEGDIPILTGLPLPPSNAESFRNSDLMEIFDSNDSDRHKATRKNHNNLKAWQEALQILYRCSENKPRSAIMLNCEQKPSENYLLDHLAWVQEGTNFVGGKGSSREDKALALTRACLKGEQAEDPRELRCQKWIYEYLKEEGEAMKSELRRKAIKRYEGEVRQEVMDKIEEQRELNLVPELGEEGKQPLQVDEIGRSNIFSFIYYNIDIHTTLEGSFSNLENF